MDGGARERAVAAFNLAADHFDHPALGFWEHFGRGTVDRLGLRPGARVLDVCCGSGSSALAAAEAVGPGGHVLGIDLAESLLELGRAKAEARGLANIEFRKGDLLELDLPEGSFDAVVCVFGIFFCPDIPEAVRILWRLVAPGGVLAVTTWLSTPFDPMSSCYWEAVGAERPDLVSPVQPSARVNDPERLRSVLVDGGVPAPEIESAPGTHRLGSPDDWWTMVLGSGYRRAVSQMDPEAAERVRQRCLARIAADGIDELDAGVLYAVARR